MKFRGCSGTSSSPAKYGTGRSLDHFDIRIYVRIRKTTYVGNLRFTNSVWVSDAGGCMRKSREGNLLWLQKSSREWDGWFCSRTKLVYHTTELLARLLACLTEDKTKKLRSFKPWGLLCHKNIQNIFFFERSFFWEYFL